MHSKPNPIYDLLEKTFVFFAIIIFSGGIIPLVSTGGSETNIYSPQQQIALMSVFALTTLFSLPMLGRITKSFLQNPFLTILILLQFLAIFWVENELLMIRGAIAAAMTTLFAVYIFNRFNKDEIFMIFLMAFSLVTVLNLAFALILPDLAYHDYTHSLRGIYINRNATGSYSGIALIFLAIAMIRTKNKHVLYFLLALMAMFVLIKTGSKTPLVGMFASLGLCFYLAKINKIAFTYRILISLLFISFFILAILLLIANFEAGVELVGKDATLSGRVEEWFTTLLRIWDSPILGIGVLRFESADEVIAPHNSWLSIWLRSGILGLLIYIAMFTSGFIRSIYNLRDGALPNNYLYFSILAFLFLRGITEALYFTTLAWVLVVLCTCDINIKKPKSTLNYMLMSLTIWAITLAIIFAVVNSVLNPDFSLPY